MKKLTAAVMCAVFLTILTGCSKDGVDSETPSELIVNSTEDNSQVSAFPIEVGGVVLKEAAQRVVCLSPAVTEIISELDLSDRIVGISSYCDYPENLSADVAGSAENPDIDKITALNPNAVITLTELSERDVYTLETSGISVIYLETPRSMEDFAALYKNIASVFYGNELTDSEKQTEKATQIGNSARTAIEAASSQIALGSFIYVTGKMTIAGADTFESAVLSLCGENLCGESGYSDIAQLSGIAPDYIVADNTLSLSDLREDETLSEMLDGGAKAVFVTSRCFERPTARTAEVFGEISAQLNSETAETSTTE